MFNSLLLIVLLAYNFAKSEDFFSGVTFTVYKNGASLVWDFDTDLTPDVCTYDDKFAFIVHGWQGASQTWPKELLKKLQKYRGGCVIIVGWAKFSEEINYGKVVSEYFSGVSAIITSKLQHLKNKGVNPDDIYMYGHSIGGRLVLDAGIKFGTGRIGQIDVCDVAGPGFKQNDLHVDSRDAAQNVQCIHTSALLGSVAFKCHQDWLMGFCGVTQPGANPGLWVLCQIGFCPSDSEGKMSHNLCNTFYINAFEEEFVANNYYKCPGVINSKLPSNFRMGYMEPRKSSLIHGAIAAPTSKKAPFTGV